MQHANTSNLSASSQNKWNSLNQWCFNGRKKVQGLQQAMKSITATSSQFTQHKDLDTSWWPNRQLHFTKCWGIVYSESPFETSLPEHLQRWAWIYGTPFQRRFRFAGQPKQLRKHGLSVPRRRYLKPESSIRAINEMHQVVSVNLRVPWVLLTRVLPICRTANIDGAFTSYQSLRVKGSTLQE